MKILQDILEAQNGGAVKQLAARFGLGDAEAGAAVAKLLPALTEGLRKNAAAPGGAEALARALESGSHRRYIEDPARLVNEETVRDGEGILGHLLGSKDVSRRVAANAAEETGIDTGKLKQMLPLVAAMAMGSLSKESAERGASRSGDGGGVGGLLSGMLDSDGDGSVADDLLGMAQKFLR
jgi:hypothetical protein